MAVEALYAGKHVILEKPMALNLEDADRIIAASKVSEGKLCVVLQNRYNPPMQDLRKAVDQGCLGRLLLGNATMALVPYAGLLRRRLAWYVGDGQYQDRLLTLVRELELKNRVLFRRSIPNDEL